MDSRSTHCASHSTSVLEGEATVQGTPSSSIWRMFHHLRVDAPQRTSDPLSKMAGPAPRKARLAVAVDHASKTRIEMFDKHMVVIEHLLCEQALCELNLRVVCLQTAFANCVFAKLVVVMLLYELWYCKYCNV